MVRVFVGGGWIMFDDRQETKLFRQDFLKQIAASADLNFLMMGFFDCTRGVLTESWLVRGPQCGPDACQNMALDLQRALAVQASLRAGRLDADAKDRPLWLKAGPYMLGIGQPVADMFPVLALPAEAWSGTPALTALLRIGMAYAQQQLTEEIYSRSPWPDGLVEATLQVLSLRFLLVNGKAELQREAPVRKDAGPDDPEWIILNSRLTLRDEKERRQLHEAIRRATESDRISSIIPVSTASGAMRLTVVAPLARTEPPLAMVLFEQNQTDHTALREHFFRGHGLTPSEQRIAHVLLDGGTLNEAATATALSLATVRSYLKRVFTKTGTHRQSELIALYYRSILPVCTSIARAGQPSSTGQTPSARQGGHPG